MPSGLPDSRIRPKPSRRLRAGRILRLPPWIALAGLTGAAASGGAAALLERQWVRGGQVFRSGVEMVHIAATVQDADGRLVSGLRQDDFLVYENGVLQTLAQFSAERVPVSLGILLDVSDSMHGQRLNDARAAIDRFVTDLLSADDEAFLGVFNHEPRLVTPWMPGPARLHRRLAGVHAFGGTAIYDALMAALGLFEQRRHQRAALVIVSDGADTASNADLVSVRRSLLDGEAFVYAIGIESGRRFRLNEPVNLQTLREITDPTGGYTELVASSEDLGPATARIASELNHQYMLGYSPIEPPDGLYRTVRVRVRERPYTVRARRGYVAADRLDPKN